MRVLFIKKPFKQTIVRSFFAIILCFSSFITHSTSAEVINIPLARVIATKPITSLEIVSIVKSFLNGRILFIKKESSYSNPDCHTVKMLEDKGEFQVIKVGCRMNDTEKK